MLVAAVEWELEGPPSRCCAATRSPPRSGSSPGPELGDAVRELEAAQYAGEVGDRDGAIAASARPGDASR